MFNALTSPMYTYLSLGTANLFGDVHSACIFLGGLFLFLSCCILVFLLHKQGFPSWLAFVPSLMIASTRYYYLVIGMETNLYLFLILVTIYLFLEEKYLLLSIAAPLLFLTRGESAFLILTLVIFHFIMKRKFPRWYIIAIPLLILAANYLFHYLYYGEALPHTLTAKIMQGRSGFWGEWSFLQGKFYVNFDETKSFILLNMPFAILFALLAIGGWLVNLRKSIFIKIFTLFLALLLTFYLFFNLPYYLWYYAPFYLFANICVAWFIRFLLNLKSLKNSTFVASFKVSSVLIPLIFIINLQLNSLIRLPEHQGLGYYKKAGRWILNNTTDDAKIACAEIGHIGWYSRRHIIDVIGLVNPHNAQYIGEGDYSSWLNHYDPDYFLIHEPIWSMEKAAVQLMKSGKYLQCNDFDVEGLVLLRKNETRD